ncbi:MAG: alpha/beta hydrolase [Solirubrobacteraceae bacterium]|nr:alpha/beta hydrolase [Solirubrobacteraceae bacterium]
MNIRETFNVRELGDPAAPSMVFAHGFGCEQGMWRHMVPSFTETHHVVLFDHMGLGGSDPRGYDAQRYSTLDAYAEDVLSICEALDLRDVTFVGHSVSASIGMLAARMRPELFSALVLVCPSPRYIDDPIDGYRGGFSRTDIDELLETLSHNYLGWAASMAPVIMGAPADDPRSAELTETFCRADPEVARGFAAATFLADNRDDLEHVQTRTLVLQSQQDVIAPPAVGAYVAEHLPDATLTMLDAVGHCPNLSAPAETVAAIKAFL